MLKTTIKIDDYKVVIEEDKYESGNAVYVTQVPELDISDYGQTLEEAIQNTRDLIKFHIRCMELENKEKLILIKPSATKLVY